MRSEHRRFFLKQGIFAGVGFLTAGGSRRAWSQEAAESTPEVEQVQFACIGLGGKGASDSADAGLHGNVVAVCDVDEQELEKAGKRYPEAKRYFDFRAMLDEMGDKIDAVTVSTPDHTHAVAAVMAMKMGKHCFCQKPLTHSVYEARVMADTARKMGVKTQMGNQGTADSDLRRAAALLKAGAIGKAKEVHVWSNRPVWPQGIERPKEYPGIPRHLHWYEWLGPAPDRPYHPAYHPFKWRGFWDFGTGALGDMACHTFNMPFMGLDLRDPISITAKSSGHNGETFPKSSVIHFEFGERNGRPPCKFVWYDGGERPGPDVLKDEYVQWVKSLHPDVEDIDSYIQSGTLVIGTSGALFTPGDYSDDIKVFGADEPQVEFEESPGHFTEWVLAIEEGGEAVSNFPNYAGPLTETILLGNLALWKGDSIRWDAQNMKAISRPDLDRLIRPEFREGYTL